MNPDLPRFMVFLTLAAAIHLAVALALGKLCGGGDVVEKLPQLDMSSVELSLLGDNERSAGIAPSASPQSQPPTPVETEPPVPVATIVEDYVVMAPTPSQAPSVRDFVPPALLPSPPESPRPGRRSSAIAAESSQSGITNRASIAEVNSSGTDMGDVPPSPATSLKPKYPESSRRRREEGIVSLDIEVDIFGHAAGVSVAVSSGSAKLDAAAVSAMRNARFTPATSGGSPVPGRIRIPICFRLSK